MRKTVCELFAGVGGFRCGLNRITTLEQLNNSEKWETVWFNQWEPAEKNTQYAHGCYVNHFGECKDLEGKISTNTNIELVEKQLIPDFNLLVGGFPCQDYSVAASLATSKGLEGKKGVLWWSIREILEIKKPAFVLLENVDRLLKSPAKQRGRDFGVILACFRDEGYNVEWRVINAAEYGYQQRRRRTFIFAYRNDTKYYTKLMTESAANLIGEAGFFARTFAIKKIEVNHVISRELPNELGIVSEYFNFNFENSGALIDGTIYTVKTEPSYNGRSITLGDIIENAEVDESFFIPHGQLYYTSAEVHSSDETVERLPVEARHTWQYLKGGKRLMRKSSNGHEYVYSEGPMPMIDEYDRPARTMLTSEGSFSRSTHIVKDRISGNIRLLTPTEAERIQGFPTNWTKETIVDGNVAEMPRKKRLFMMGNALVVNIIAQMEPYLAEIIESEN